MKTVHFDAKPVNGISVRTNNTNEMQPDTAKIGGLWQIFHNTVFRHLKNNDTVYGIYHDYESDANGDYSVLIGSEHLDLQAVDAGRLRDSVYRVVRTMVGDSMHFRVKL